MMRGKRFSVEGLGITVLGVWLHLSITESSTLKVKAILVMMRRLGCSEIHLLLRNNCLPNTTMCSHLSYLIIQRNYPACQPCKPVSCTSCQHRCVVTHVHCIYYCYRFIVVGWVQWYGFYILHIMKIMSVYLFQL